MPTKKEALDYLGEYFNGSITETNHYLLLKQHSK